ncbi:MAG: TIGR04149 family rSAM-modified RiPP [Lentimicrobiaceae bacterium]|nr:TIGR04149 family rSAM-modified RiPP [Lentimicrobiaceae bacterium]
MKNIKLTNLSRYELLNDELKNLKGGDEPELGPLCFGCNCACTCTDPTPAGNITDSMYSSKRHSGFISSFTEVPPVVVMK